MNLIDITPVMTSDNTPSPYIVTASTYSSSFEPYKAFNKNEEVDSAWKANGVDNYIQIDCGETKKINTFKLVPRKDSTVASGNIKEFELLGSINGSDWNKFFTGMTESNLNNQTFQFKEVEYRFFKLNVISNYGGSYVCCSELYYLCDQDLDTLSQPIKLFKTLKTNLPKQVENNEQQIHFTDDGGIYITKNDGSLKSVGIEDDILEKINNGGDVIIKDISNPLTTSPIQSGYFTLLNDQTTDINIGNYVKFNKQNQGNVTLVDGQIQLKKGKSYLINLGIASNCSKINVKLMSSIDGMIGTKISGVSSTVSGQNYNSSCSTTLVYDAVDDCSIKVEISEGSTDVVSILKDHTYINIIEIRNNPVNQYGGFEVETLFDGNITTVGEYKLTDKISNYDIILIDFSENTLEGKLLPIMTSNTSPEPYKITTNGEAEPAYLAFNGVTGQSGNVWYSTVGMPKWIKADACNFSKLQRFSIENGISASGYDAYPAKSFILEGSVDDIIYEELKSVTDMKKLGSGEKITFDVTTDKYYRYYKLTVTDAYYQNAVIIGELTLEGEKEDIITTTIMSSLNEGSSQRFVLPNGRATMVLKNDLLLLKDISNYRILKIVGIHGSLPSLSIGGVF